jgi:transglutaminase-like putative cysteine protease
VPVSTYRDLFGNRCRRLVAPAGDLTMWGDATIWDDGQLDRVLPGARELSVPELPDHSLVYLMGSRCCETDRVSQIAWDLFGTIQPGWSRVQAICNFVHNHIRFDYMQARSTRTAFETFNERVGVCRDFAHLAITFCRCLNIPARYVNGHLGDIGVPVVDPMDFSAWIEVFLDGEWHTFDPRNNVPRIGRIVVARGRDATDIPPINSFGRMFSRHSGYGRTKCRLRVRDSCVAALSFRDLDMHDDADFSARCGSWAGIEGYQSRATAGRVRRYGGQNFRGRKPPS